MNDLFFAFSSILKLENIRERGIAMIQIKTFRFIGSKTKYLGSGLSHENIKDDEKVIDKTINDFIKKNVKRLEDIKITTVDCNYHNNGGYNTVDLIYTIIYEPNS